MGTSKKYTCFNVGGCGATIFLQQLKKMNVFHRFDLLFVIFGNIKEFSSQETNQGHFQNQHGLESRKKV